MNLRTVAEMPRVRNNMHESLFRSYHVLGLVKEMLQDGVPPKTILMIIESLSNWPESPTPGAPE